MPLTFTVLRCPNSVVPETRTISGGEFTVGRGPGVDWVLPDPERLLSKHHFAIAYRGGAWQIADTSTNGTTMNADLDPIGRGQVRTLRDGDRLKLGAYEIEVRLNEEAIQPGNQGLDYAGRPASGTSPFADPFAADPFAPPAPPPTPFGEPAYPAVTPASGAQLPPDFDPLAPDPGEEPFRGTQPDHSPLMEDAFRPPAVTGQVPLHTGGKLPGDGLLPDDWDEDLLEGIGEPGAPSAPPAYQPPPPPVQRAAPHPFPPAPPAYQPPPPPVQRATPQPVQPAPPPVQRAAPQPVPPAPPPQTAANPFDEPVDLTPAAEPGVEGPVVGAGQAPAFNEPFAAALPSPSPPAALPAQPAAAAAFADDGALLAAFLEGVGLADARPADPAAIMRGLGKAFRAMVSGLRAVLIARASVKSEFRIEQTMIQARGNNPLKFSAGDDDALAALLGTGRRTDMSAAAAVADALKDIRLHELATMAAMQTAVRSLLEGLDPAKLRAQAEQGGGLSLLPAQRKARAWDAFEALHARTAQALSDDFDSVFGKAFARAYERAMDEVSAKERR